MRETSELYKRLLADDGHVKESRLIIGGTVYDESHIVSLSTTEPLFAADTIAAGGAVAREIDFVAFLDESVPKRAQIVHEVRLRVGNEVSEWLQKGVYYIDTRRLDPLTGVTTVHGFDAMLMAEQPWHPADPDDFPMSMQKALEETAAILKIALDPRNAYKTGDDYKVDYPVADGSAPEEQQADGLSIRQVWRWIAGAMGGNFIINDLGELRLVPLNALPGNTGYLVTEAGQPITFGSTRILVADNAGSSANVEGDKVYVGKQIAGIEESPALDPITKIILKVDDNNAYVSESDTAGTGMALEISCAYGNQKIANDLLAQLEGYAYQPVQAEDALIDPAAELGDGVTVSGVYTVLAQKDTIWDALSAASIGAPGNAEMESEYPFVSAQDAEYRYQLAQTRSLIAKTAEEIKMGIYGEGGLAAELKLALGEIEGRIEGVEGDATYIRADLDGITTRVQTAEGDLATLILTAESLKSEISGKIDSDDAQALIAQELDAITLSVSSSKGKTEVKLKQGNVTIASDSVDMTVKAVNITGTVTAGKLRGGSVDLLSSNGTEVGGLSLSSASSAAYAVALSSKGALKLAATGSGNPSVYLEALGKYGLGVQYVPSMEEYYVTAVNCGVMSSSVAKYDCGSEEFPWRDIYSLNDPTVTSDANLKYDGEDLPDKYVDMFDRLQPKRFKLKAGTSGRFHPGYYAQDVKAAMDAAGIDSTEFGGWVLHRAADGTEKQMLRYNAFDAIRDAKIKQMDRRLKKLEELYELQ